MIFATDRQRAVAYAAYKELEQLLKLDGQIAPGADFDLSGEQITICLTPKTRVSRNVGDNGIIRKKATQNLYGYMVWSLFLKRLKKFNQWNVVKAMLVEAWHESIRQNSTVKTELDAIDPELAEIARQLQDEAGPMREEPTPRMVNKPKGTQAQLIFQGKTKKDVA
jgi:hypothetical protein